MEIESRRMIAKGGWIGLALAVGSLFFRSPAVSLGVAAGVVIGLGNLYLIVRLVRMLLDRTPMSRPKLVTLFLLKMILLFGIIGLILTKTSVSPVALAVGFSAVVLALIWEGLLGARRESPPSP